MSFQKIIISGLLSIVSSFIVACTAIPAHSNDNNINALTKQYQQLRARQKALPIGTFDKELSGSGGQLEKVLAKLGEQLGNPKYRQEDIIRLMGKPDQMMKLGDYQPPSLGRDEHAGRILKDETGLIYYWRGGHDYLYFISKDGIIQSAHWYFAGE